MDWNSNSLFNNAIKQVKSNKTNDRVNDINNNITSIKPKSKLYSSNMDEDIEFEKENAFNNTNTLNTTNSPKNMNKRYDNVNRFTPYKAAKKVPKNNNTPNLKIIKNNDCSLDNSNNNNINGLDNNLSWEHDLYLEQLKNNNVIVVNNLPKYMTGNKLNKYFSKYGDIIGLNVQKLIYI